MRELQFLVMAELEGTPLNLSGRLARELEGAAIVRSKSLEWMSNWVQISENDDYDPRAVVDPEDGFLSFRFRIEVSPVQSVDLEHQVRTAVLLSDQLRALGARTAVCADFEELIPEGY